MSGLILIYSSIKDWLRGMAESFIARDIFQADTEWMHIRNTLHIKSLLKLKL